MKKVISSFLLVFMLLNILSTTDVTAYAADEGACGGKVTFSFDSATGTMIISGSGKMNDYKDNRDSPFAENTKIKKVVIELGVTSIGNSAFRFCTSLTSVVISDSVTSIGIFAFCGCTNLTSIKMPDSVTNIGYCAFYNCESLSSVTIPDSVTSIDDSTFEYCTSLTSVTIPNSVTSIGSSAFRNCTSLTSITIPNSVTSISDYTFYNCTSLTEVYYSGTKAQWKSISIGSNNEHLTSAIVHCSDGITFKNKSITQDNVKYVLNDETGAYVSGYSGNPKYVTISDKITYSSVEVPVTSIGNSAFSGCTSLECITLPKSLANIGNEAFNCCENLTDVYYEGSKNDWNAIGIGENNDVLINNNINIMYNCVVPCETHIWNDGIISTSARCITKGIKTYTCKVCGKVKTEEIPATGHSYTSIVKIKPTCEKEGKRQYTCTKCNDTYTETIEPLGHDTKIVGRVEPTLTEDGYYHLECQRDGCEYSNTHTIPQLILDFNKNVEKKNSDYLSSYSDTYKIAMEQSGYLIFDFEGESEKWEINIYDEDYKKISTLKPVFKEFYKKSYLQKRLNSDIPNENQIVTLLCGEYYVEINRISDSTNDNYSGNYKFSIDYQFANETISETKNDFYYDAPTAKDISLNKSYNGFLGATYASMNYAGKDIITQDERDAYKIVIPQGSGLSKLNISLSSKAFAPLGSNCTLYLYNSEFELYEDFKPLTVELNCMASETVNLNEGVYYIAVTNSNSPIEYSFTTQFNPYGTYICVNHKYELKNVVNPTCETDGYNYYVCKICSNEYKEILPATGHTLVNDSAVSPTCISSGLSAGIHCSKCGAVIKEQIALPKTLHNFANNAQYCLNGCGTANPNYVAPTQPTKPSQPTNPTPAQPSEPASPAPAQAVKKPKSTSIKKAKGNKKAVALEWKKVGGVKGYEIQLATDKKFKKNKKTVNIKKQKTTKTTVKKLKAKKKYYVRIRTYKTVNGKKVYSSWSKVKTIKTK